MSLLDSTRRLAAGSLGLARTRLELAATELDEQIVHQVATFLGALVTILLGMLAAGFAAAALVIAASEGQRLAAALGAAGLFLVLAIVAAFGWRAIARARPRPFEATLEQLERDRRALEP